MSLFWYKRKVRGKDGEVVFWDTLNTECIVRGLWRDEKTFSVLLNDGHEQAEDKQRPVFKNGKPAGVEVKRERDWYYSQIDIDPADASRLSTGRMHPTDEEFNATKPKPPKGQIIPEGEDPLFMH